MCIIFTSFVIDDAVVISLTERDAIQSFTVRRFFSIFFPPFSLSTDPIVPFTHRNGSRSRSVRNTLASKAKRNLISRSDYLLARCYTNWLAGWLAAGGNLQ